VSPRLTIKAEWEPLLIGSAEDRATLAAVGIIFNSISLTEAEDSLANRLRQNVHLSAYRLAEWLAWNWWRLRWEPRRNTPDWIIAHSMTSIGGGYIWPNITILSDGERVVLDAQPTAKKPSEPLRYIAQQAVMVPASEYEFAVDTFVSQVIERLRGGQVGPTNLDAIWDDLRQERHDPDISTLRKLEALMGKDVDEANHEDLEQLVADASALGKDAINELAAQNPQNARPLTATAIEAIASAKGFDFNPRDSVRLEDKSGQTLPRGVVAWKRGVAAADALRQQLSLGAEPISNRQLAELLGASNSIVTSTDASNEFPFALENAAGLGKIALRSKYQTGRRFALGRLLGDRIGFATADRLRPATSASTYRQQMQRAFAGEFLCPFEALLDNLDGDMDDDKIEEASEHFNVSEMTVRTLLANHGLLQKRDVDSQLAAVA
jgi:hypothetical protein